MQGTSEAYGEQDPTELAALLHRSDRTAYRAIFQRYWKRLYTYAYRIHDDAAVCEDIVQTIFAELWEKRERQVIDNLEGYLFRAVKYSVARHLRRVPFTSVQREEIQALSQPAAVEQELAAEDLKRTLQREIAGLPPRCRRVFELSRYEHLSNAEIAEALDISVRTVEKHITDALRQLRGRMEAYHLLFLVICLLG